uniref:Uncharacterized protein n=1 Tax=viral metagenome TaxID=1070528 RepID=A0A6H1ZV74_9ZZZZ
MADQRIQYTEEMVGAGHPTKSDTLNRIMIVEHGNDGTHPASLREKIKGFATKGTVTNTTCLLDIPCGSSSTITGLGARFTAGTTSCVVSFLLNGGTTIASVTALNDTTGTTVVSQAVASPLDFIRVVVTGTIGSPERLLGYFKQTITMAT